MKTKLLMISVAAIMLCASVPVHSTAVNTTHEVYVATTQELLDALADAKAGDEIILAEGIYENDQWMGAWAAFYSEGEGTSENPIILRSKDPENPATLCGATQENKVGLYITGDYWIIQNIKVTEAQKGIVLDHSNYSVISGCEVYDTGMEGIHLRDNSSWCLIESCNIHDNGTVKPGYGEGIYIGSAKSNSEYGLDCHYNTIRNCQIGPNTAAEHIDIKEYTIGTVVEDCIFDGAGMTGENYADSFIDIKGNDVIIRNNTGYQNGNNLLKDAFQLHVNDKVWGQDAQIYQNTIHLDNADGYVIQGSSCTAKISGNVRIPDGNDYQGNLITEILPGDVNADGILNTADISALSDFLLARPVDSVSLISSDLSADGILNVFDLVLVKREILNRQNQVT